VNIVVADASAIVEYLLRRSAQVAAVVEAGEVDLHVPELCDIEVAAALRRAVRRGGLALERARQALEDHLDLPLTRHGHAIFILRIFELRDNFTPYDATYAVLAHTLGASLLTADVPFGRAARARLGLTLA
jgi:predicted nucleic acid-binding protein